MRINTMVSTTVSSTTRVPTKLRQSSRRTEESNNIGQFKSICPLWTCQGMNYRFSAAQGAALSQINADALLVILSPAHPVTGNPALDGVLKDVQASRDWELKTGKVLYVHRPAGVKASRVVLVAASDASAKALKNAVALGVAALKDRPVNHLAVLTGAGLAWETAHAQALVQAVADASYVYRQTKPSAAKAAPLGKISVVADAQAGDAVKAGLRQGQAVAEGVGLARELGNLPPNHCTPTFLAQEAKRLAKEFKGLSVQVLERPALEKLGMGSFLSVTNGTAQPPKFIILRHDGGPRSQAPIVLVGKGITFDSGGISLKPGAGMDEMKYDMGGAASVLGTFRALGELKPKVNVI